MPSHIDYLNCYDHAGLGGQLQQKTYNVFRADVLIGTVKVEWHDSPDDASINGTTARIKTRDLLDDERNVPIHTFDRIRPNIFNG